MNHNYLAKSILLIVGALMFSITSNAQSRIVVQGEGVIKTNPDEVTVFVVLWAKNQKAKEAQAKVSLEFERLQKLLSAQQIAASQIQTISYDVTPEYDYSQNTQKFAGTRVSHTLSIRSEKTDQAGQLVDTLSSKENGKDFGINIQNLSWSTSQYSELKTKAMELAAQDCQSKADRLAKSLAVKVQKLEQASYLAVLKGPPASPGFAKMSLESASMDANTQLSAGKLEITSQVDCVYLAQ